MDGTPEALIRESPLGLVAMAQTTNAHRGFDYATTVDGETVPTASQRSLARRLKRMSCVSVVGWSGTRAEMVVRSGSVDSVLDVVSAFNDKHDHIFSVGVESVALQDDDARLTVSLA